MLSPLGLSGLGAIAAIVRWIAMAFDPPLALLIVLQILHALTFGATHIGTVHFIAQNVPAQRAGTAQALQASVTAGMPLTPCMALLGMSAAAPSTSAASIVAIETMLVRWLS